MDELKKLKENIKKLEKILKRNTYVTKEINEVINARLQAGKKRKN